MKMKIQIEQIINQKSLVVKLGKDRYFIEDSDITNKYSCITFRPLSEHWSAPQIKFSNEWTPTSELLELSPGYMKMIAYNSKDKFGDPELLIYTKNFVFDKINTLYGILNFIFQDLTY